MRTITAEEFRTMLNQAGETLENLKVTGEANFRIEQAFKKTLINCKFGYLNVNPRQSELSFSNCQFQTLIISPDAHMESLDITDCVSEEVVINANQNVSIRHINLAGANTNLGNFKLEGGFRSSAIKIKDIQRIGRLNLELNSFNFEIADSNNIEFAFIHGKVNGTITIKHCSAFKFFSITEIDVGERIEVSDSKDLNLNFNDIKTEYINFTRCTDTSLDGYYITAKNIDFMEGSFNEVHFSHSCDFNLSTTTRPLIQTLKLSSTRIAKGYIFNFEEVFFEKVFSDTIRNEGLIQMLNCQVKNHLSILKSDLGKCYLTNVEVATNCRVDILDCNLLDVQFNSFRWNKNYHLFEEFDPEIEARYHTFLNFLFSLRESYRQLKANYIKHGNKIESLEFHKGEMSIHYRILHLVKYKSTKNFGNFLIVGTNKWFSDFGQNVWKPFFLLFLVHLIILNLLIHSFDLGFVMASSWAAIDPGTTMKAVNLFFQTLLPVHPLSVKDALGNDVSIAGLWDFIARLSSGYFIYYFISASRKYHQ